MKREELTLNKLFYNNRFVLFFSIILAVVIWLIVAIQYSPEVTRVIKNVPVDINLSNSVKNFDLQIFGTKDFYVDITVVGKRYVVSSSKLSADDFSVVATTNYVDSSGKQTLQLEVKPKSQSADYSITKVSNDFIEVYFDVFKEGEYTLVPQIEYPSKAVPDGYFKDTEVMSAKTVTISGPATEINKINKVYAKVKIDKTLTSTKTFKADIVPLGEYGDTLSYLTIDDGNGDISITVPVYKLAELPTSVSFKNVPANYLSKPLKYTCSPAKAYFAVNETALESMTSFNLGTIDFSNIKSGINSFTIKSNSISDAKVMDKTKLFKISVDASGMSEIKLPVKQSNISVINVPDTYNVAPSGNEISSVTVVGPLSVLKTLTSDDIMAEIDLNGLTLSNGNSKAKASLYVNNHDDCWIYGNYNAGITVTTKQ